MRTALIILLALPFIFLSCSSDSDGGDRLTTPSGFEYIVHTSSDGEKSNPGDYVYFHCLSLCGYRNSDLCC